MASRRGGPPPNAAQIDFWNANAGQTWAKFQPLLDQQLGPLGEEALRVLAPGSAETILDIGCGCGDSTLALAAQVGPAGRVVGVDISRPMLEVARQRRPPPAAGKVEFRQIDAQSGELGRARFDSAFSRFGVMFFGDPVAAFTNLRCALKPGGRLTFVCWRSLQENPWMLAPLEAALPFLPPVTPIDPLAPGPFAFADFQRVRRVLVDAAFERVTIMSFDTEIGGADLEQTRRLSFRVGPLAAALREHPDYADRVAEPVERALRQFETAGRVMMPASVWIASAERSLS
jgi:SAM-dependent methyltransferase